MAGYSPVSNLIWNSWNQGYYTTGGATYYGTQTTVNAVWVQWNQEYYGALAGTTAASNVTVWGTWNQQVYGTAYPIQQNQYVPPQQTEEQRQADVERLRVNAEAARLRAEEAQAAAKKAKELLIAALTLAQREQFAKENAFELQVNDKLYRIRPGHRVERLNSKTKKTESYFCIHPSHEHRLPNEDVALGQKLFLEAAEAEFLRIANETRAA